MLVRNKDQRPGDYKDMAVAFRPSHADATYQAKYGIQARSGGGRASARETIGRVAAGAIAKQLLRKASGTEVLAWVKRIHTIEANAIRPDEVSLEDVEANIVRCDQQWQPPWWSGLKRSDGVISVGVIECVVRNPAMGLGIPMSTNWRLTSPKR